MVYILGDYRRFMEPSRGPTVVSSHLQTHEALQQARSPEIYHQNSVHGSYIRNRFLAFIDIGTKRLGDVLRYCPRLVSLIVIDQASSRSMPLRIKHTTDKTCFICIPNLILLQLWSLCDLHILQTDCLLPGRWRSLDFLDVQQRETPLRHSLLLHSISARHVCRYA